MRICSVASSCIQANIHIRRRLPLLYSMNTGCNCCTSDSLSTTQTWQQLTAGSSLTQNKQVVQGNIITWVSNHIWEVLFSLLVFLIAENVSVIVFLKSFLFFDQNKVGLVNAVYYFELTTQQQSLCFIS